MFAYRPLLLDKPNQHLIGWSHYSWRLSNLEHSECSGARSLLLFTGGVGGLCFGGTSDLVHSSLHFLELLSSLLADDGEELVSSEIGLHVALLSGIERVVNESESGRSTTSELGLESEHGDGLFLVLEHNGKLGLDGSLGDGSLIGMNQLNLELSSLQERVVDHLSGIKDELLVGLNFGFISHFDLTI
jgi:hypothetical protein